MSQQCHIAGYLSWIYTYRRLLCELLLLHSFMQFEYAFIKFCYVFSFFSRFLSYCIWLYYLIVDVVAVVSAFFEIVEISLVDDVIIKSGWQQSTEVFWIVIFEEMLKGLMFLLVIMVSLKWCRLNWIRLLLKLLACLRMHVHFFEFDAFIAVNT